MSSSGELACSYAVMILHDDGIPVTAEKIATLIKAANVECESYWPSLFAKLVQNRNIDDLITNVGAHGGGGGGAIAVDASAPTSGGAATAAPPAAEEKKEEVDESDDEISNLFGDDFF